MILPQLDPRVLIYVICEQTSKRARFVVTRSARVVEDSHMATGPVD